MYRAALFYEIEDHPVPPGDVEMGKAAPTLCFGLLVFA